MEWDGQSISCPGITVPDNIDYDTLLTSAFADIIPDLDALTSAIEARETINMVISARRTAKELIHEALRGGKHTVKAAANAWLAWRYGWEQLGRDVKNVYDLMLNPYSLVIEGRAGESYTDSATFVSTETYGSAAWESTHDVTLDASFRANVVGILKGETLNVLADPAISLWETIPYSFVADWFVNVGDVLGAWKVRNSLQRYYTSIGSKMTFEVSGQKSATGPGNDSRFSSHSGSASSQETLTVLYRRPGYTPTLVPSFNVNLTSKRLLDAAALLSKRIL
jgi:hypothetical protein